MNNPSARKPMDFAGKVSPDWLGRGVWLTDAALAFSDGNTALARKIMTEGAERFTVLRDGETPEFFLMKLVGKGSTESAELLAQFNNEELIAWRKYRGGAKCLEMNLLSRLRFGTLVAFGDPERPGADHQWIPVRAWMHLKQDVSCRNKVSGEAGAYWYVKVIDPAGEGFTAPPQIIATPQIAEATETQITEALRYVYATEEKPPNINQLYKPVNTWLKEKHVQAKKSQIQEVAQTPEFVNYRRRPGREPKP